MLGWLFSSFFFRPPLNRFFFLLTPRRSSWPRSNGYTNDFGLIFCFPHRPSSLTHSFFLLLSLTLFLSVSLLPSPLSLSFHVFISLLLSIPLSRINLLTHTYIHPSASVIHSMTCSLYFKSLAAACLSTHTQHTRLHDFRQTQI